MTRSNPTVPGRDEVDELLDVRNLQALVDDALAQANNKLVLDRRAHVVSDTLELHDLRLVEASARSALHHDVGHLADADPFE